MTPAKFYIRSQNQGEGHGLEDLMSVF